MGHHSDDELVELEKPTDVIIEKTTLKAAAEEGRRFGFSRQITATQIDTLPYDNLLVQAVWRHSSKDEPPFENIRLLLIASDDGILVVVDITPDAWASILRRSTKLVRRMNRGHL